MSNKPTYIVLMQPTIVAQDIALTIQDHVPGATVILARTPDDAFRALEAIDEVAVAFLAMDPDSYSHSDLARMIRARGGRVVLLGDAAEEAGRGPDWIALMRPFTTEYLISVLDPKTLAGPDGPA